MSEFEQILDECLISLQATGSVEAALAVYPEQAEALRPLLLAAAAVQNSPRPLARPAAVREGRQRIQAAWAARRESGQFAGQPAVFGFLSVAPAWWRGRSIFKELLRMNSSLRPVFTFLAVFIIGGTFLVATSGNSLPGEPLYPVKQLWEAARLALTADPQARQLIEEELRQERIEELRGLIESGREQLFTFEARLEAVQASRIVVDGFTVLVNRQTVWQDQPVVGQMVRLEVYIQGNGTMTARRIQLAAAGQVLTPTEQATTCNNFTCETVTPSATAPTPEGTPTPTPAGCNFGACPTETGEPTGLPTVTPSPIGSTPNATPTVCNFGFCGTITPTPTAAGQATATATPMPTWTPTACNNPSCGEPTDEPTPPPNDTATPAPVTATASVTPACPPVGCNEPTATPTPAVTASATPVPPATPTAGGITPSPTPCNGGACEPPTPTPAGSTPSPTPCNGGICEPPTATPWETVTPTAVPTQTPDPLPSPTPCNWGACGGPSEPTNTPNP